MYANKNFKTIFKLFANKTNFLSKKVKLIYVRNVVSSIITAFNGGVNNIISIVNYPSPLASSGLPSKPQMHYEILFAYKWVSDSLSPKRNALEDCLNEQFLQNKLTQNVTSAISKIRRSYHLSGVV